MEFKKIQTNQPPLLQYNLLNQLNPQLLPLFQNLLLHKMLLNLLFQSQPQHSLFNLLKTKQPLPMQLLPLTQQLPLLLQELEFKFPDQQRRINN